MEFVTLEDVSVPAGTFPDCIKLEFQAEYVGGGGHHVDHAYWWYAEGVGLVKEDHRPFGGTQWAELVAATVGGVQYPSDDEQAIRDLYQQFEERVEAEDSEGVMALFSDEYLRRGQTKSDWSEGLSQFLAEHSGIDVTISDLVIAIADDTATATMHLMIQTNEGPEFDADLSPDDDEAGICFVRKENDHWLFYGDHSRCWPDCAVAYWDEWLELAP
jgi:ketosteroid isomerase-like protein